MSKDLADRLAQTATASTRTMPADVRADGIRQMLSDLHRLTTEDGCIAAAWALEWIEASASRSEGSVNSER